MQILFFLENYYPKIGGVETLFKSLAEALVQKGHQVKVLTTRPSSEVPSTEWIQGVEIVRLAYPNRYLFTFLSFFSALKHVKQADFIHTTSYNAALPALLSGKCYGKKVSVTFHEVWGSLWFKLPFMNPVARFFHYLFEQFLLKLPFHTFIAVSQNTATRLLESKIKPAKIKRIYNGIDYSVFETVPEPSGGNASVFTFTYFGRLGMSKGLDILTQAIALLRHSPQEFSVQLIIPTEPRGMYRQLKSAIKRFGIADRVVLTAHLPYSELLCALKQSDSILIPSYSEGFCYAAVEAIALGVPVISSDQGALKEVVSGKFIKMKHFSPQGLAEAMTAALEGKWSVSPVKKFNLTDTVRQYEAYFEENTPSASKPN